MSACGTGLWSRIGDGDWSPQFMQPVWGWAVEAASVVGLEPLPVQSDWTAPALPGCSTRTKEGLAFARNIRSGASNLFEAIRERGYDPRRFSRVSGGQSRSTSLGLKLDSDPRYLTAGQLHPAPTAAPASPGADADNTDD